MRSLSAIATVLAAACTAGCSPLLVDVSTPPPSKVAEHTREIFADDVVHLSRGVVIAFDCLDPWDFSPCHAESVRTDDPAIARVLRAHLERQKSPWGGGYDTTQKEGYVLVGVKPGATSLFIGGPDGGTRVRVIVE